AAGFGATAKVDFRLIFAPLNNDAQATADIADTAAGIVGDAKVDRKTRPISGSEDFAFMLEKVPGAYILIGNGDTADPHNTKYDFNDAAIPFGAAAYAGIVERKLAKSMG